MMKCISPNILDYTVDTEIQVNDIHAILERYFLLKNLADYRARTRAFRNSDF